MNSHPRDRLLKEESASLLDPALVEKVGENDIFDDRTPGILSTPNVAMAYLDDWTSKPSLNAAYAASSTSSIFKRVLYGLIPSFVQSRLHPSATPDKVHPTAYLDGIRGLAAFAVYICHFSYQCFYITFSYGSGDKGENNRLIQFPWIRLFYSGPPAVAIFFVISGYALSYKPLRQMRAKQWDGLMATLSSSVFRRPFRLFLPCFASTLLVLVLVRLGAYEYTRPFAENKELLQRAHFEDHAAMAETTFDQLCDIAHKWFDFVHAWDFFIFGGSMDYDRHLWTIPTEFRASMVLFLTHAMCARLQTVARLGLLVALIYWGLQWDRWEMLLFWAGMFLAELDHIRIARANIRSATLGAPDTAKPRQKARFWWWFWILNLVIGTFLMSYPDEGGFEAPGFVTLTEYIPEYYSEKYRFWQSIGAVQTIWAVNHSDALKACFNGPVVQYLGKLSFALYLMHGPVIHTFAYTIMPVVWSYIGTDERWSYEFGFFLSFCLTTPLLIWTSDVFWRAVDIPCVRFAKWIEEKVIVKSEL